MSMNVSFFFFAFHILIIINNWFWCNHSLERVNVGKKIDEVEEKIENSEPEENTDNSDDNHSEILSKKKSKKKLKKSNVMSLDFTSEEEDHNSDSDFKGNYYYFYLNKIKKIKPNVVYAYFIPCKKKKKLL